MVIWLCEQKPGRITVSLVWMTRSPELSELHVIDSITYNDLALQGAREFKTKLPVGPYSFSGNLFSLIWGVQALVEPSGHSLFKEISVSPARMTLDVRGRESGEGLLGREGVQTYEPQEG